MTLPPSEQPQAIGYRTRMREKNEAERRYPVRMAPLPANLVIRPWRSSEYLWGKSEYVEEAHV